jgi:hypothetical protein
MIAHSTNQRREFRTCFVKITTQKGIILRMGRRQLHHRPCQRRPVIRPFPDPIARELGQKL